MVVEGMLKLCGGKPHVYFLQLIRSIASHHPVHFTLLNSPLNSCMMVLLFLIFLPWEEEFKGGTDGAPVMKATDFHRVFYFLFMSVTVLAMKMARRQKVLCPFHAMRCHFNLQMRFFIFILFIYFLGGKLTCNLYISIMCIHNLHIYCIYSHATTPSILYSGYLFQPSVQVIIILSII